MGAGGAGTLVELGRAFRSSDVAPMTAGTKRVFQSERFGGLLHPVCTSKGTPPCDRPSKRVDLGGGQGLIDAMKPVIGARYGPVAQTSARSWGCIEGPRTSPYPVFGSRHQATSYRVTLHVTTDGVEMAIILKRKRLEQPLINVTLPFALIGNSATGPRASWSFAVHEIRELIVLRGPKPRSANGGHQAIGQDPHRHNQECLL